VGFVALGISSTSYLDSWRVNSNVGVKQHAHDACLGLTPHPVGGGVGEPVAGLCDAWNYEHALWYYLFWCQPSYRDSESYDKGGSSHIMKRHIQNAIRSRPFPSTT